MDKEESMQRVTRKIKKVFGSKPTVEGAGVHLKRAFGFYQVPQLDPFLLLDDFQSNNPQDYIQGFPWHPHRGIETITYVLRGEVEHGDSMGNKGIIRSGDVQWMTAGSGIIHQEMPKGEKDGLLWGFQLWANLPTSQKMIEPRYLEIKKEQIPQIDFLKGVSIKIIAGEVNQVKGPVTEIVIDPQYLDISVDPKTGFDFPVKKEHTVFVYTIEGKAYFDSDRDCESFEFEGANYFDFGRDCLFGPENLIVFGEGDELIIETTEQPARFLLVSGKPLREPVAWRGPIVMNTDEELKIAFEEYQAGTFIKH
jgi:redox-sensitive bicupin YhaK (pirin superfamily)